MIKGMNLRIILICFAPCILICCKQQDSVAKAPKGSQTEGVKTNDVLSNGAQGLSVGFLTASDLSLPNNISTTDSQDIASEINDESGFVYHDGDNDSSTEKCIYSLFDQTPFKGDAHHLEIDLQVTNGVSNCLSSEDMKMTSGMIWARLILSCDGADISRFVGKKYKNVKDSVGDLCQGGKQAKIIYNIKITGSYKYVSDGQTITFDSQDITATTNSSGGPCVTTREGDVWRYQDCQTFSKSVYTNVQGMNAGSSLSNTVSLLKMDNVTSKENGRYFNSGTIKFKINDLDGKMAYKGVSQNPTWTLDNGKAQGTFTGSTLNLHGKSLKGRMKKFSFAPIHP